MRRGIFVKNLMIVSFVSLQPGRICLLLPRQPGAKIIFKPRRCYLGGCLRVLHLFHPCNLPVKIAPRGPMRRPHGKASLCCRAAEIPFRLLNVSILVCLAFRCLLLRSLFATFSSHGQCCHGILWALWLANRQLHLLAKTKAADNQN